MTVTNTQRYAGPYIGNGTTSVFPFVFKVFAATDITVLRTTTSLGTSTTLAINTDYTVSLNANQDTNPGGSVTLTAGNLASGFSLLIRSVVTATQSVALTNQGGFYPDVINDALDRGIIIDQQQNDRDTRAIRVASNEVGGSGLVLPPAIDRANQYLAFDSAGNVDIGGAVPDQRYYGTKTSDPATRNDGTAIQTGDLYYNVTANVMKVYTGAAWASITSQPTDGDKGDITLSGGAATYTIDAEAVTLAKMANLATDRLIGRDTAGTGVPEALTVGGGIEFTGSGGIQTSALTGVVTKTAGGTVTSFASNPTFAGTVTVGTGNLVVSVGNAIMGGNVVIGTAGNGIDFSATTHPAGMTSELLDDYEVGTWSPVYEPATGTFTTMTMDIVTAKYVKIGDLVILNALIRTDEVTVGTASGQLFVSGLPFAQFGWAGSGSISAAASWSTNHPCGLQGQGGGSTRMLLTYRNTAGNSAIAATLVTHLTAGVTADQNQLVFSATYFTA